MTHLERNTRKGRTEAAKSVSGEGENPISQLLQRNPSHGVYARCFRFSKVPPQILLFLGITKRHGTPTGVPRPFAKIERIGDEVDVPWEMFLGRDVVRIEIILECALVESLSL